MIKKAVKNLSEEMKLIIRGYKVVFQLDKAYAWMQCIYAVVSSAIPLIGLLFSSLIITELAEGRNINQLYKYVVMTLIIEMLLALIKEILSAKINMHSNLWYSKIELLFSKINTEVQYMYLEDSDIKLLKEKIKTNQNATGAGLTMLINLIYGLTANLFTVIFSISLSVGITKSGEIIKTNNITRFFYTKSSGLLILLIVIIFLIVTIKWNRDEIKKVCAEWARLPESNRILGYYQTSIMDNLGAMDIRVYNQSPVIMEEINKWTDNPTYIKNISKIQKSYGRKKTFANIIMNVTVYLYVGIKVYLGIYEIGKFIQYTGAINKLIFSISGMISSLSRLFDNNPYLKDIFKYLDLPKEKSSGSVSVDISQMNPGVIEFRNVSFRYPRSDTYALKKINITIKANRKIAIVGENGSGKSTFVKLLCGLYQPSEGEILLCGRDISSYKKEEYNTLFSVIFQDFNLFSFSLGQNIAASVKYDPQKAESCIEKVGLKERYLKMKQGLETILYKDFDVGGIEISGGEAQKIAIARALYKDSPYIIMDEPTAALDPKTEFEIYRNFNSLTEGKTVLFISHRLASCCFCDEIIVFENGEIVQYGTHQDLLKDENGKYSMLWKAQAQYYQN
jgi:ATP-binding cassette subfamily B protein